jgi:hypothetical protein
MGSLSTYLPVAESKSLFIVVVQPGLSVEVLVWQAQIITNTVPSPSASSLAAAAPKGSLSQRHTTTSSMGRDMRRGVFK